jgi:hypothetical protein
MRSQSKDTRFLSHTLTAICDVLVLFEVPLQCSKHYLIVTTLAARKLRYTDTVRWVYPTMECVSKLSCQQCRSVIRRSVITGSVNRHLLGTCAAFGQGLAFTCVQAFEVSVHMFALIPGVENKWRGHSLGLCTSSW